MSEQDPNPKTDPEAAEAAGSNLEKDPADWVTGEEPMTGAQASYLKTLYAGLLAPIAICSA